MKAKNVKLKQISLEDGTLYMPVNIRIKEFRKSFTDHGITCEIIKNEGDLVVMKASVKDRDGFILSEGIAAEVKSGIKGDINYDSHYENCQTSAIGRALGVLGIGIDKAIASREEVMKNLGLSETPGDRLNAMIK